MFNHKDTAMNFDLGLKNVLDTCFEDVDDTDDLMYQDMRDGAANRLVTLTDSIKTLSSSEQRVVLDFLSKDPDLKNIIGDDPSSYMDRLSNYTEDVEVSEELIGVAIAYGIIAYSNRYKAILKKLSQFKDSTPRAVNTFDHNFTKDVRIIPVKEMNRNIEACSKFIDYLLKCMDNMDKFDIKSLIPYYHTIGLKITDKHTGYLIGGSLAELIYILAASIWAGWAFFAFFLAFGPIPAFVIGYMIQIGLIVAANKGVGGSTKLRNTDYTSAAQRGWNMNNLVQMTNKFYVFQNKFEKLETEYKYLYKDKAFRKQYKNQFKAIKQATKTVFTSLKGNAKSLLVLYESVTKSYGIFSV
jgi:hypothetical protein